MTRRAWALIALGIAIILLTLVLAWADRVRGENLAGAVEISIPEARQWWAEYAACADDREPYPEGVLFYQGDTVPSSWVLPHQTIEPWGGFAGTGRRVMFWSAHPDRSLVIHEIWHIAHDMSHPPRLFGDATHGPICGLARP